MFCAAAFVGKASGTWNGKRWGGEKRYDTSLSSLPLLEALYFLGHCYIVNTRCNPGYSHWRAAEILILPRIKQDWRSMARED